MKVWIIAENKELKTVVSNKQKVWREIVDRLFIDEDHLKKRNDRLNITVYPNWTDSENMDLSDPRNFHIHRQSALYPVFKMNKAIKLQLNNNEETLTIWEREVK